MRDLIVLCHRIPYPPDKGDKIRAFHMVRALAEHYRIHLAAFVDDPDDAVHEARLAALCADVLLLPLVRPVVIVRALWSVVTGTPLSIGCYRSITLRRWLAAKRCAGIGAILAYSSGMAPAALSWPGGPRVADFVDVDSAKWAAYAGDARGLRRWIYAREARHLAAFERHAAAALDATVFVSAAEARCFLANAPQTPQERVHAIPNGVDVEFFHPADFADPYGPGGPVAVFTGAMDYRPNVEAVRWFVEAILPRLQGGLPEVRFAIVGARPAAAVRRLAVHPGVIVTGRVRDVRPYLVHAAVSVAPLRVARGIQNKVLEAMAMARPVVATPEALEGITARAGEEVLAADTPDAFARAVRACLDDPAWARALGAAARARVRRDHSWQRAGAAWLALLDMPGLADSSVSGAERVAS
ncbi:TIGR03087 family PEP-CTERM/XrtA system glycosyltransferase [Arhodomonas sp. SL1]|uniref:TIGR03087 family PEP-CTERM/XrtA system glycosyltransferase n=1 Tax=Arhodomonas sp. SL1 TaxID=3425691 RepID=UPI003F88360A